MTKAAKAWTVLTVHEQKLALKTLLIRGQTLLSEGSPFWQSALCIGSRYPNICRVGLISE